MNMDYRILKLCQLFGKVEIDCNNSATQANKLVIARAGGECGYGCLPFMAINELHEKLRPRMPKWDGPGKPAIEC